MVAVGWSISISAEVIILGKGPGLVVHRAAVELEAIQLAGGLGIVDVAVGVTVGEGEGPIERGWT